MEVYSTENEQVDAIKQFFKNYGLTIVLAAVIGFGGVFGWKYWQSHQTNRLQESAGAFATVSEALAKPTPENIALAEKFVTDTNDIYGALASLELAQIAIDANDLVNGERHLTNAVAKVKNDAFADMLNLRLARVQLALDKTDVALVSLEQVKGKAWNGMKNYIRGDVLAKKGDNAGAATAYRSALTDENAGAIRSLVELKLNNLSN
ncbi:YfgM family protein [Proteus terrae]|uniref:Tetratricopeptide repeat protein n=1 Tax=Proteus terrae subsp. cibarius TaxID=626774 RepID=A0A8I1BLY0_9GAMM|nr:YfgM family protein [Proteus terrae]QHP77087.1 tetratricopeptide repeat protein [Proteus vulgaris]MBG2913158.1 YfgM family protein [Proteus terrae subsp. cibarius]MBG3089970.1 YfgM family protein [Proteus terrae subsp. cibarius]MCO4180496.1 YfgM family protein [Proteus terrae]MCO4189502.1 YfgM family protein [Proteus terrae]